MILLRLNYETLILVLSLIHIVLVSTVSRIIFFHPCSRLYISLYLFHSRYVSSTSSYSSRAIPRSRLQKLRRVNLGDSLTVKFMFHPNVQRKRERERGASIGLSRISGIVKRWILCTMEIIGARTKISGLTKGNRGEFVLREEARNNRGK